MIIHGNSWGYSQFNVAKLEIHPFFKKRNHN